MGEEHRNKTDTTRIIVDPVLTIQNSTAQIMAPSVRESKYMKLLGIIQELGRHIKPFYAGRRYAAEEVRNNIISARILVKECLHETQKDMCNEN